MITFISEEISEITKYEPIKEIQCRVRDPNIKALVLVPTFQEMQIGSFSTLIPLFVEMQPYDGLEILFRPRNYDVDFWPESEEYQACETCEVEILHKLDFDTNDAMKKFFLVLQQNASFSYQYIDVELAGPNKQAYKLTSENITIIPEEPSITIP